MHWVWFLGLNGLLAFAANRCAGRVLRQPSGLTQGVAAAVIAWSWLTVGMQLLGSLGLLSRWPLLAWLVVGLAGTWLVGDRREPAPSAPRSKPRSADWGWEGLISLGLLLWVCSVLGATSTALPVKVVSDGPIYHLLFAIRWWKSGRLELVPTPFGENAAPYFPATGDLWFAWLVIGWGGDLLARVGQAPFLLLCAVLVYGLCRQLGAPERPSMVATCWFASSTPLLVFSFEPNVDTLFIAGYLGGVFFLVRYWLRDDGLAALLLSGLALGCALGTKAVGVVFIPPVLLCGVLAVLRRESDRSTRIQGALILVGACLLVSGYWFARNAWLTGNPLYPLHLQAFGRVWLPGWYGPEVMPQSQYYIPVGEWRALVDTLLAVADPRLVPFWALAVLGAWRWGRGGDLRSDRVVWLLSGLAVLNVLSYWLVIPYRTQQRFMLQALGLAAVPLARLLQRSRALTALAAVLLAVHLVTEQGWLVAEPGQEPPWDFTPIIPNSYSGLLKIPHDPAMILAMLADPSTRLGLAATFGLGTLAMAASWGWSRFGKPYLRGPVALAVLGTALLFGLHVAAVSPWDGDPRSRFYARFPDYYRGWIETDRHAGTQGVTIAYAGTNLPYYLFGPDLRNDVRYININPHRDWRLHDYHREASRAAGEPVTWPHPRPGWDRAEADYRAWLENLRAADVRLLVVARANPVEGPYNVADAEGFTIERVWADTHPESFQLLHGAQQGDPLYRLYRVISPRPSG